MARRRRKRDIALPWEQRSARLRGVLSGSRWKILLVVLALGGAAVLLWRAAAYRTRVRSTRVAISAVETAISEFRSEVGRCPDSLVELVHPPDPGRQYLPEVPLDGWGHRLWVRCPARHDPEGAEVVSAGPSGSFLEDDNIQ